MRFAIAFALALLAAPACRSAPPELELVESFPAETALDQPDLRDTAEVWRAAIDGARASLDLAQFYASDEPPSRLTPIVAAIERAAGRGVRVRFLCDARFHETYPQIPDRLARTPGIEVRRLDFGALGGGVLHAKYFLVDGREVFLGSQNLDWRSLEHIQELGVRLQSGAVAAELGRVFELDWRRAGAADPAGVTEPAPGRDALAVALRCADGEVRVTPVHSPRHDELDRAWDLPRIVALIDGARSSVRVQLLTYKSALREGGTWDELEGALLRAAARGVPVQLLLADWCQRAGTIEGLQRLEPLSSLEIRLLTIPQHSRGFVPYARVAHAKYLVVDGERAWIGTSNWERGYFYQGRNVGLIVEGRALAARLDRYFLDGWSGPHARPVDPQATYAAPRIGE